MKFKRSELDAASRAYLRRAETLAGSSEYVLAAVYVRAAGEWFAGPRAGWQLLILAGVLALAFAYQEAICAPNLTRAGLAQAAGTVGSLAALGVFCFLTAALRARRPDPVWPIGNFVLADSNRLWVVNGPTVEVCEFAADLNASVRHFYQLGVYRRSEVVVRSSAGSYVVCLRNRLRSDRLVRFVAAVGQLRTLDEPSFRLLARAGSAQVGNAALCLIDDLPLDRISSAILIDSPSPYSVPALHSNSGWRGIVRRGSAATALGIALSVGVLPVFVERHDDRMFSMIPQPIRGDFAELPPLDRYLSDHPNGRHVVEVRGMKDDHSFALAERMIAEQRNPAPLRRYLAVTESSRHRAEAMQRIEGYYDRTLAELRSRAIEQPDKIDRILKEQVAGLIAGLKALEYPVVTVGFAAEHQTDPVSEEARARELTSHLEHIEREPQLREIAALSPTRSAILPHLQAFEPEQAAARAQLIYDRLAAAVQTAIHPDILRLRQVVPGEQAMLEVRYRIAPSGVLYLHKEAGERVKGVIRGYEIKWEIVVRPPGGVPPLSHSVEPQPLNMLKYKADTNDPEWAPYAVLLYSAFHDFSDQMIRSFALDPGPAPGTFAFSATSTRKPVTLARDRPGFLPELRIPE